MSRQNVELARKAVDHYLKTGEPAWSLLHDDIAVHDHDVMDAGEYRGHAGFQRWFEDWAAPWSEFSLEPQEYVDAGDHVVAVIGMTATGRSSGVTVERQDAMVMAVQDGKVVRLDYYNNRAQAVAQVGLAD